MKTGIKGLRNGFSTGSISAAVIKASLRYYFKTEKFFSIEIKMPGGETASINIAGLAKKKNNVSNATAIKDSGDDPDVTNGIKICADFMKIDCGNALAETLSAPLNLHYGDILHNRLKPAHDAGFCMHGRISSLLTDCLPDNVKNYYGNLYIYNIIGHSSFTVILLSSKGIGVVGRQGLPVRAGFPAINPVPFKMIELAVREELRSLNVNGGSIIADVADFADIPNTDVHDVLKGRCGSTFLSILYVPEGEVTAKKTLNPRLGIKGGISILGTTGYVVPISTKAWLETIKSSLSFLLENNITDCVFTPGRFSEKMAMKIFKNMPEECFIEAGDYISYSLRKAVQFGIKNIIFSGQFGKILKIAQGARNTNAKYSKLDLKYLGASVKMTLKKYTCLHAEIIDNLYEKIISSNTSRQAYYHILSLSEFYEWLPVRIFEGILKEARLNLLRMTGKQTDNINITLISYEGGSLASTNKKDN